MTADAPTIAVVIAWAGDRSLVAPLASVARAGIQAGDAVVIVRDGPLTDDQSLAGRGAVASAGLPPGVIIRVDRAGADAPTGDHGAKARTVGGRRAGTDWVAYLDDDDVLTPWAFATWRGALAAGAGLDEHGRIAPLHFRAVVNNGTVVHDDGTLRVGNVSTLGVLAPRHIVDVVAWPGRRYQNDFDFLVAASTFVNRAGPIFVDCRPVAVARYAEPDGRLDRWGVDVLA